MAIDGVELFSSYLKSCEDCLTRVHSTGKTEYYHRSVVCMSIGSNPHLIFREGTIKPRDGNESSEGELTEGKRLIRHLYERRRIYQDAEGLFKREGEKEPFKKSKIEVKVWDLCGFEMNGLAGALRVLKFEEQHPREKSVRRIHVVTDLLDADYKTIWTMMHLRWDIENNGFHQLKTYNHADHCFVHNATENLFLLNIIAFNPRELFLYRQMRGAKSKMTRREVSRCWMMSYWLTITSPFYLMMGR